MWKLLYSLRNKRPMCIPMYTAQYLIWDIFLCVRHTELTRKPSLKHLHPDIVTYSWPLQPPYQVCIESFGATKHASVPGAVARPVITGQRTPLVPAIFDGCYDLSPVSNCRECQVFETSGGSLIAKCTHTKTFRHTDDYTMWNWIFLGRDGVVVNYRGCWRFWWSSTWVAPMHSTSCKTVIEDAVYLLELVNKVKGT